MKSFLVKILAFGMILLGYNTTMAQEESTPGTKTSPGTATKSSKTHTLDFEDELIEGGIQKPDLFYLIQRKNFNFKKLVRLRENFLPEMRETADSIREGRNKN